MSIDFAPQRWQAVKAHAKAWWAGDLGRPLIQVRLKNCPSSRPAASQPFYPFASFYDLSVSADDVIDAWDYELSRTRFLGDAFPEMLPNFGPGSIAAYMGAKLENGNGTVWFHPAKETAISELQFDYIPDNPWFVRTKDIIQAAVDRWQGSVQVALTDLGGNMDILSTFRPSEKLMYDLFDCPEDVKRLNWRAHEMWWKYFEEFNGITVATNPGYTSWASIFSEEPHYILQCDFCFMTGPDMFEEFVKPELAATAEKLTNVFYHLDGPGELRHLDSLLDIEAIHGIQWVPGAGQPDATGWAEVYQKITNAGRKIHLHSNMADDPWTVIDAIAEQTGRADNIVYVVEADAADQAKAEALLKKYNCL